MPGLLSRSVAAATMFEKSLQDLVKGLRNTKGDTTAYVAKAIQEIKDESKSRDVTIKAQALQKLTYVSEHTALSYYAAACILACSSIPLDTPPLVHPQLNMMGHDMTWASFTIIEIMSQVSYIVRIRELLIYRCTHSLTQSSHHATAPPTHPCRSALA